MAIRLEPHTYHLFIYIVFKEEGHYSQTCIKEHPWLRQLVRRDQPLLFR